MGMLGSRCSKFSQSVNECHGLDLFYLFLVSVFQGLALFVVTSQTWTFKVTFRFNARKKKRYFPAILAEVSMLISELIPMAREVKYSDQPHLIYLLTSGAKSTESTVDSVPLKIHELRAGEEVTSQRKNGRLLPE